MYITNKHGDILGISWGDIGDRAPMNSKKMQRGRFFHCHVIMFDYRNVLTTVGMSGLYELGLAWHRSGYLSLSLSISRFLSPTSSWRVQPSRVWPGDFTGIYDINRVIMVVYVFTCKCSHTPKLLKGDDTILILSNQDRDWFEGKWWVNQPTKKSWNWWEGTCYKWCCSIDCGGFL